MAERKKSWLRGLAFGMMVFALLVFSGCGEDKSVIPSAPSNLQADAVSGAEIDLAWTDNSNNEVGFKIEQKTGAGGTYSQIGTVLSGVTGFPATGLDCETTYYFQVRAFNGAGDSGYSNAVSATAGSCSLLAPAAPSDVQAAGFSSSQIDLSWTDNSDNEDEYRVERADEAGGVFTQAGAVEADETAYRDRGLVCETTYYYRVGAYNEEGGSSYSETVSATTGTCPLAVPAAPSNLHSTVVSSSQINLYWTDNSDNEDEFQIERKTGAGGTYTLVGTVGTDEIGFQDGGLTCETTYSYRVRAYNGLGASNYSHEEIATTQICPVGAPTAPSNLTATVISTSQVHLSWADNSGNEQGFKIERKTGTGGNYTVAYTAFPNATSWNDAGLSSGATYFYRVFAYNPSGNSDYSNEVSATIGSLPDSMASLPAGSFNMGDAFNDGTPDELPVGNVNISAFQMDIQEVTNAQYKSCVDAGECTDPSSHSSDRRLSYYGNAAYDNYPVIYVSWDQAKTYCEWLGKRLPTEAEWEYAARGGLSGKRYPWGDDNPTCSPGAVNGAQCGNCPPQNRDTTEVGSFSANGYGLYDMAGNVWEWVNDWYSSTYYNVRPTNNPTGPFSGFSRTTRGGGWDSANLDLRVANRNDEDPTNQGDNLGFRCAK